MGYGRGPLCGPGPGDHGSGLHPSVSLCLGPMPHTCPLRPFPRGGTGQWEWNAAGFPTPQVGQALIKPHAAGESPEVDAARKKGPPHCLDMIPHWSPSHGEAPLTFSVKAWQGSWGCSSQHSGLPRTGAPLAAQLWDLSSSSSAVVPVFLPRLAARGLPLGAVPGGWFSVPTWLSLQSGGQWFALRPHFSNRSKKRY